MTFTNSNLHFLVASLPAIRLGEPLELSFEQFDELLKANLGREDREKVQVIRKYYDIVNFRYLILGKEIDLYGTMSGKELEEAVISGIGIPDYFYDFTQLYEEKEDRLRYFPKLFADYFNVEGRRSKGFLHELLKLEREIRLVLTALRAKFLRKDIVAELQFENPNDDLVQQILAQKDAKSYELPSRYEGLKALYESKKGEPFDLYQAIGEYRFEAIEEMLGVEIFTLDRVIGYMVQLIIAEQWLELDKKKGMEILDTILEEKE